MAERAAEQVMGRRPWGLGIRGQMIVAFGGVFLILLVIYLYAGSTFDRFVEMSGSIARDHLDSVSAAGAMRDGVDQLAGEAGRPVREGQPIDPARFDAALATFDRALALQESRVTLPGEDALTGEIRSAWATARDAAGRARDADGPGQPAVVRERLAPALRELRPMLGRLSEMNIDGVRARDADIRRETSAAHRALHLVLLVGLLVAAMFALLMGGRVVRPLAALTASAKAASRGDLDRLVPVTSHDELGQLAAAFNAMTLEVKRLRALDADRLRRALRTTQAAIDSLPDGVVMIDERRAVELANETAHRLFGLSAGQAGPGQDLPWLGQVLERPDEPPDSYRPSIEVRDGDADRSFLPRCVALRNADGRVIGWTVILVDVTAFRRLDRYKDSLLSMASHELKTPLTSMRMLVPLLLEQTVGPLNPRQAELLGVTRDAMERMRHIVETILDLGRLAGGRMPADPKCVDPARLAATGVAASRHAFEGKGVALRTEVPADLPRVRCDPGHIDHVFSNLLSNALRHTPAGGEVVVSAAAARGAARDDAVRFEVRDTGCGIAAAHVARVFETFYRVPGQPSDSGTGLGLSLVKQIVESHGGEVGVASAPGTGSTFWFTLLTTRPGGGAGGDVSECNDEGKRSGQKAMLGSGANPPGRDESGLPFSPGGVRWPAA